METNSLMVQYEIEPYRGTPQRLRQIAVAFTGTLKNGREAGKVLLLNDPLSQHSFLYEFRAAEIVYVEECPSLALPDGSMVSMVRLWVKKGTTALQIVPFHVADTTASIRDMI